MLVKDSLSPRLQDVPKTSEGESRSADQSISRVDDIEPRSEIDKEVEVEDEDDYNLRCYLPSRVRAPTSAQSIISAGTWMITASENFVKMHGRSRSSSSKQRRRPGRQCMKGEGLKRRKPLVTLLYRQSIP